MAGEGFARDAQVAHDGQAGCRGRNPADRLKQVVDALARVGLAHEQEPHRAAPRTGLRGRLVTKQHLVVAIGQHLNLVGDARPAVMADRLRRIFAANENPVGQFVLALVALDHDLRRSQFQRQEPIGIALRDLGHRGIIGAKVADGPVENARPTFALRQFKGAARTARIAPQREAAGAFHPRPHLVDETAVADAVDPPRNTAQPGPRRQPFDPFGKAGGLDQSRVERIEAEALKFLVQAAAQRRGQQSLESVGPAIRLIENSGGKEFQPPQLLEGQRGLPRVLGARVENRNLHTDRLA